MSTTLRVIAAGVVVLFVVALFWAIRVGSPKVAPTSGVDGLDVPWSSPAADHFVDEITHPWLPLTPGARWEFAVEVEDRPLTLTVDAATEVVEGITATVLRQGEDWTAHVAQDVDGNVWLLALAVPGDTERSWSIAAGAPAGLVLPAEPRRADGHAVAAPHGEVTLRLSVEGPTSRPVETGSGTYDDVLVLALATVPRDPGEYTREWTVDLARGVGPVMVSSHADGVATLEAHTD